MTLVDGPRGQASEAVRRLAATPTPLEPLDRLARHLGRRPGSLYAKRDDLTGLAGGGSKARKLVHLCTAAVAAGADHLVSGGGVQSNHARMTAAAAGRLGMRCTLLLQGSPPEASTGNLLLDELLGAEVVWTPPGSLDEADRRIRAHAAELRARGSRAFAIPTGGSHPVGALGMADSADEVQAQLPDAVVVLASGSGGTQAGYAAVLGDHARVVGVEVGIETSLVDRVGLLTEQVARLLGRDLPRGTPQLVRGQVGPGYGHGTPAGLRAMRVAAELEGLLLDPTYTAKAFAHLLAGCRDGSLPADRPVVFVHTGGLPGLFSRRHTDWAAHGLGPADGTDDDRLG